MFPMTFWLAMLPGVLVTVPLILPPIRSRAQALPTLRIALMLFCAILAFGIMYGFTTILLNSIVGLRWDMEHHPTNESSRAYQLTEKEMEQYQLTEREVEQYHIPINQSSDAYQLPEMTDVVVTELWIRQIIPVYIPNACYTTAEQCAVANEIVNMVSPGARPGSALPTTAQDEWAVLGVSLIPMLTSLGVSWLLTRPKQIPLPPVALNRG